MSKKKMLGEVSLLGLEGFGSPGLSRTLWGTLIGGGTSSVTAIAARYSGKAGLVNNAEIVGLTAGLAVSGVIAAMPATRSMALPSAVGAFLATGLAWLERKLFGSITVPSPQVMAPAAAGTSGVFGLGIPTTRALQGGLGIPQARQLQGLGIPQVHPNKRAAGTAYPVPGVAGNQLSGAGLSAPPVSLLGPRTPQSVHLLGMGGPSIHGLSAAYGATTTGGGR